MHDRADGLASDDQMPMMGITMHDRASQRAFPVVLAAAVRQRRKDLDLKQVELAELAGCSTRFLHTVEAGKATIRLDKLLSVLRVLGLGLELEVIACKRRPRRLRH